MKTSASGMAICRGLHVLLMSCAVAVALASTGTAFAASTVSYSEDGTTLVVTGDDHVQHSLSFQLLVDENEVYYDKILDYSGITSFPENCFRPEVTSGWDVICPAHSKVKVVLGDGWDSVDFGGGDDSYDCFEDYDIDVGEGGNTVRLGEFCTPGPMTATVRSGSGGDSLYADGQGPVTFFAGGGSDQVTGGPGDDVLHGGEGDDSVWGGGGNDQVLGEGGNDSPNGGAGNDLVDGGPGDDELGRKCVPCAESFNDPDLGSDTYVGGPGDDLLRLDLHPPGMAISIDGVANDGNPGENDNVGADIELVNGTAGNDTYTGSPGPDGFDGGDGNDVIHGGDGNDVMLGGYHEDQVFGDAGDDDASGGFGADRVFGGIGNDHVYGSDGDDTIDGGPGTDSMFGNDENDVMVSRDGERDSVVCGLGADSVQADPLDIIAVEGLESCESIERQAIAGPAGSSLPVATTPATAGTLAAGTLAAGTPLSVVKGVGATVTCPAACTFTVSVVLSAKTARKYGLGRRRVTVGTARGSLPAAGGRKVVVKLSAKARRKLRRARRVAATLEANIKDPAGTTTARQASITLRRR